MSWAYNMCSIKMISFALYKNTLFFSIPSTIKVICYHSIYAIAVFVNDH